jgi:UDP-N-acetylmuramoyl-tripeptide--D-alanyl-D-alanine ligase
MLDLFFSELMPFGRWTMPADYPHQMMQGVVCDSRLVMPGQLFVALPGQTTDGHIYLDQAAKLGAIAAIVHTSYRGPDYGMALLAVEDTLATLQGIAAARLAAQKCRVVAITGSVGKTTTKEFLTTLLAGSFRTASTPGNANSQIGLPLALLNTLCGDEEIVVCEMGMSYPGELRRLVAIAPPTLAILANVHLAHAAHFISLEHIARAKAEILSHPATELALIPTSIPNYAEIAATGSCRKLSFSADVDATSDFTFAVAPSGDLNIISQGRIVASFASWHLPGGHNSFNFMLAAIAAHLCGVSWEAIAAAQPLLMLPERRLQYVEKDGVLFVNDAYNACLASVAAALDSLPPPKVGGRRIAALGEMLELGTFSEPCHRTAGELALSRIDALFCLGPACIPMIDVWQTANRSCALFDNLIDLSAALKAILQPGDVVLLKGSRSKQMWKVLEEV